MNSSCLRAFQPHSAFQSYPSLVLGAASVADGPYCATSVCWAWPSSNAVPNLGLEPTAKSAPRLNPHR
jgi:hypothetical protein